MMIAIQEANLPPPVRCNPPICPLVVDHLYVKATEKPVYLASSAQRLPNAPRGRTSITIAAF